MALVLPLLLLLLTGVVDAGLAVTAWLRVNTAARDATRFALDAGRPGDTASLVLNKLNGLDQSQINVYIIKGTTDSAGTIPNSSPNWVVSHPYGAGPATPNVQPATVQAGLQSASVPFVVVKVDLMYQPLLSSLLLSSAGLPMSSYAVVQTP